MSSFTDSNMPANAQGATNTAAMAQLAREYTALCNILNEHTASELGTGGQDPHKVKAYIDEQINAINTKATTAKSKATTLERLIVGDTSQAGFGQTLEAFFNKKLDNKSMVEFVVALVNRIEMLEDKLNTLSLLQFDNVPVGAGIRWYKDTLPEDGTYVWANGQTLYGVNQNFPELARVWELGSSDNVRVPKEDHTIFKVR